MSSCPEQTQFVVCGEKVISDREISDGIFRHINVDHFEDIPAEFEPFVPSSTVGRTSFRNAIPVDEVVRNQGWIFKTVPGRAPTRGRFGTHATSRRIKVRPRKLVPPAMSYLAFKRLAEHAGKGVSVFFQITEVLNRNDRAGILRCLNLLQENVGLAELRPVQTAEAEAIRNLNQTIGWEILKEYTHDPALTRVYRRLGGKTSKNGQRAQDRLGFIRSLKPVRTFLSTRGLVGYIVVDFGDKLTIFENLEIDHAMFIAHGPTEKFIRLSRTELMAKLGAEIERFHHTRGWEQRLRKKVKLALGDSSPNANEMI